VKSKTYNFSPGPGKLPRSVLQNIQNELLDFNNSGMSIMEFGHRTKQIEELVNETAERVKRLMKLDDNYEVIFMQGGGCIQFVMIPMNFSEKGEKVDYIDTGYWTTKAIEEAEILERDVKVIASSADKEYNYIPDNFKTRPEAAYLHICSNNTIMGTQWHNYPKVEIPVVIDMSSDILSRAIDYSAFDLVYAHAQKTIGTAGVTVVAIKKSFLKGIQKGLPNMLDYNSHVEKKSIFHTPPVFSIYVVWKMLYWLENEIGGVDKMETINNKKAKLIYDFIDSSGFFKCTVESSSRSIMNVVFRAPTPEFDKTFVEDALKENIVGVEGHRSVGGLRASIYNPVSLEDVEVLVSFMKEFVRRYG